MAGKGKSSGKKLPPWLMKKGAEEEMPMKGKGKGKPAKKGMKKGKC